jgi:acyl transferase domain-containing protein/NAD(P)-dependent dehydrogenase (short-subunit alcohol dehydrogenase family)
MCRQLLKDVPVFRDTLQEVDKLLKTHVTWSLVEQLQQENPRDDPVLEPVAIFACQVGLAAVWKSLGVQPFSIVGQSVGEVAAAYTAGCISLADAVSIIFHRSRLLGDVTGGRMVVVQNVEVDKVRQVVDKVSNGHVVTVSLEYSPSACAVSADAESMMKVRQVLLSELKADNKGMQLVDLDVSVAYHSSHVTPAADKLRDITKGVKSLPPTHTFISTVTGNAVNQPLGPGHWADNMKKPVLFRQAILQSLPQSTANLMFLELGPKPILRAHMPALFPEKQHLVVASVTRSSELKSLYEAIATCYERGVNISWANLPTGGTQITEVPRYCFDKKLLKQKTEAEILNGEGCDVFQKNHLFVLPVSGSLTSHKILLSPLTLSSVYDHVVSGSVVVPGALYAEVGFAVARYWGLSKSVAVSLDLQQLQVLEKDQVLALDVVSCPADGTSTSSDGIKQLDIKKADKQLAVVQLLFSKPDASRATTVNITMLHSRCTEHVSKQDIYSSLRHFGFEYGESFSLLESGLRGQSECLVTMMLNSRVKAEMADMTLHPSVLDCIIQTTVLLLEENGTPSKNVFPKSIDRLSVSRDIEQTMYVYVKQVMRNDGVSKFDLKLLSPNGEVIAEVKGFTVQALVSQETVDQDMLVQRWNKVHDLSLSSFQVDKSKREGKLLVIIGSGVKVANQHMNTTLMEYNRKTQITNFRQELTNHLAAGVFDAVMLFTPKSAGSDQKNNKEEGEVIQSFLVQLCLLVQGIGLELTTSTPNTPFYLVTYNAFPSPSSGRGQDVNPVATALWGMMRTAVVETVFSRVTAVELQLKALSGNSIPAGFLPGLLDVLGKDSLTNFPEMLITDSAVYVNQVTPAVLSTQTPKERSLQALNVKDVKGDVLLVTQDADTLTEARVCRRRLAHSDSSHKVKLQVNDFVQPHPKLLDMKMSAEHLCPQRAPSGFVVTALEVSGHSVDASSNKIACCCPLPLAPVVTVDKATVMDASSIPQYQVGDLSKLVLIWSLVEKVSAAECTVLASNDTYQLALVARSLCGASGKQVSILKVEDLHKDCSFSPCLLSLVLLNMDELSFLQKHWKTASRLIACSSLVGSPTRTFFICAFPNADLCLVDTQLLFQQAELKHVVPKVWDWVSKNTALMNEISKNLHAQESKVSGSGELFTFTEKKLSDLTVTVKEDSLFSKSGIYVVVGGLTGLGWICVNVLAEKEAGFIAILNRRSPSPQQIEHINNLAQQYHCNIKAFQADISNLDSLEKAIRSMTSDWGQQARLLGVFCGAAVLRDSPFQTMDKESLEEVLTPKVKGMWNMHLVTKHLPLDYFVMHSSVASVLGNNGQTNYSAANAFMDGLAFHRAHHGLAAQTINWGPLDTGLLDNQEEVKRKLDAMGFPLASQGIIRDTFRAILQLNLTQVVPVKLNKEQYSNRMLKSRVHALMNRLKYLIKTQAASEEVTQHTANNVAQIRFLDASQRLVQYESFVRDLTVRVLGVEERLVTREASLYRLGLDSVTGMMMLSHVERLTSFKLEAVMVLSADATVASIAASLNGAASRST